MAGVGDRWWLACDLAPSLGARSCAASPDSDLSRLRTLGNRVTRVRRRTVIPIAMVVAGGGAWFGMSKASDGGTSQRYVPCITLGLAPGNPPGECLSYSTDTTPSIVSPSATVTTSASTGDATRQATASSPNPVPVATSSPDATASARAPLGCLDPRAPAKVSSTSWVDGGALDYSPENAGTSRMPSSTTLGLARRIDAIVGHGFDISSTHEYDSSSCVEMWTFSLARPDGGHVLAEVLQLHRQVSSQSFPLVGEPLATRWTRGETELLRSAEPDRSSESVLSVQPDGLLVFVQVRSVSGIDPSGWPTTTMAVNPPPSTPAALTMAQATAATLAISNEVTTVGH